MGSKSDLEKTGIIFQGQIIDRTSLKAAIRQKRQERAGEKANIFPIIGSGARP